MTQAFLRIEDRVLNAEDIAALLEKYNLLPQLAREAIIDRAIEEIAIAPDEIERTCESFWNQRQLLQPEVQKQWLWQQGITPEQLREKLLRELKILKFKKDTWSNHLSDYFLLRKSSLDGVVYSLVRTSNLNIAQELYFRIQTGESLFAEVARQYSLGPEAQTGGLVGPVELSRLDPALAEVLVSSEIGQLRPPLQFGEWSILLRLEERIPAQLNGIMEQKLLDELFESWLQERVTEVVQQHKLERHLVTQ
ncbi:peptidylprolyl isomerase [Oscillatoria sp. FACHB-1406]|uniref:peptidylprolyl isomerase n=1 Tax=Oscillatoria sp. FACHB-1406 TaxID=2692846 RepID=UPI001682835D|nr:peptidylprolyl isomerase [Oscillatoria sp. FACHB-1406]MBD2579429.1 peptidylprolyl isomerase [Oscillatoria sp. FACHB-1406]